MISNQDKKRIRTILIKDNISICENSSLSLDDIDILISLLQVDNYCGILSNPDNLKVPNPPTILYTNKEIPPYPTVGDPSNPTIVTC